MRLRRLIVLFALAVAAAGCVGGGPPPDPPSLPRALRNGPPPAWVETSSGTRAWLDYSTFCWPKAGCADYALASCGKRRHAPVLPVVRGERIRFHLGFHPKRVLLHLYYDGNVGGPLVANLEPVQAPEWHATDAVQLVLSALPQEGGDASYVTCLRVMDARV